MKGTVLTLGGPPGSGKSTTAQTLADRLHREYISVGQVFREQARSRNLDLAQFSALAEKDPRIDSALDERMVALASGHRILEGRIIGELLHRRSLPAFRVLVTANEPVRARRIAGRERVPPDLVLPAMRAREESERTRYQRYYGISLDDIRYDLVVDTSAMPPPEVVSVILRHLPKEILEG